MGEIVDIKKAIEIAKNLKKENKKLVLVGGCFDILHVGHIEFLEKAKEKGDILMVLLESDARIKKLKGENRPINRQADRAKLLSHLNMVDIVVNLPEMKSNEDYNNLVMDLAPAVIAVTADDRILEIKRKQAKVVGGKLEVVMERREGYSTTAFVKELRRGKDSLVMNKLVK
jgi:rfaE bifunctional protein nucleotidyltransferase chain/domain